MPKPLILPSLLISCLVLLNACSNNVKGSWSCPVLEGGKGNCVSISDADSAKLTDNSSAVLINNQPESYSQNPQKIEINLIAPKLKDLKKIANQENNNNQAAMQSGTADSGDNLTSQIMGNHSPKSQLRTEEKVGKVWFAPFIDADGNQHSESSVFIVDEKPRWISQR